MFDHFVTFDSRIARANTFSIKLLAVIVGREDKMQDKDYSILLTRREIEILKLVVDGWSNRQIAEELAISVRTVKFHTGNIYNKLDVNTRAQAIARAWKSHSLQNYLQN